ncbi:arylamine N-acetyltransferase family protein [Azospirillum soli]|uniref:arylamine N-acetyltransferase family protein n=1 Tax=Azospirillum soli TaxID=1304799 RepID=UPI001AE56222|nr:arylamine N-acetyltransferase [Azospirillum soli]MBP2310878.1 N-hydroxyarylamine O-acetyltransferase [Azospirillum soli]
MTTMDLDAYLARIGWTGTHAPTLATLKALHEAHPAAIPFESLDVLLGRPVSLAIEDITRKLVTERRGGYCFERNTLFQHVLEAVGFTVRPLAARVRMGRVGVRPRTHMLLLTEVEGQPYLTDVGWGGLGLLEPLPLIADREFRFPIVSFRLAREGDGVWVLQGNQDDGWIDMYAFTLEAQHPADFEMANWFTSTHRDSIFRHTLTAQRVRRHERVVLRNRDLTISRPDGREQRTIASADETTSVLSEMFGITLPEGARLPEPLFA